MTDTFILSKMLNPTSPLPPSTEDSSIEEVVKQTIGFVKEISEVVYIHNLANKQTEEESLESDILDQGNPETDIPDFDIDPMLISDQDMTADTFDTEGDVGDGGI